MTAKDYLRQIKALDVKINQKIKEVDDLKLLTGGRGIAYDRDHVQTTPENRQEELIIKWLDMEREIDRMIDDYIAKKDKIINQIHTLSDSRYIKILYDHYVPDARGQIKTLEMIAVEIPTAYRHVRRLHGKALQLFEKDVLQCPIDRCYPDKVEIVR